MGSTLHRVLHQANDLPTAVSALTKAIESVVAVVPAEQVGIRFTPFAIVEGNRFPAPDSLYCALIESIRSQFPNLGFVHIVAHTLFDDFEYASNKSLDVFRAALSPQDPSKTAFILADAYDPQTANKIASNSPDLVAINLPADVNPKLISSLRRGDDSYTLGKSTADRLQTIRTAFDEGKEYIVEWSDEQKSRTERSMNDLDQHLSNFDPSLSYEGTDKKVAWRKSCWFACEGIARPFLDTQEQIARFDGDLKDGLTGLAGLQDPQVRRSAEHLKSVLDSALVTTSKAVGIGEDMIQRCTVRYRAIKYTPHAGAPGGIGLHPDGNLLSALITNGDGLRVYDLDGTVRFPSEVNGTIMMGGSTLYRWSQGKYPPTFHDVDINSGQDKFSIVAFFNFPDMVSIPHSLIPGDVKEGGSFFHDIKRIKEDDKSPHGQLSPLWDVIIDRHQLVLPPAVAAN